MKLHQVIQELEGTETSFRDTVSKFMPFVKPLLASESDIKVKFAKWVKKVHRKKRKK